MITARTIANFGTLLIFAALTSATATGESPQDSILEKFSFSARLHPQFDYLESDLDVDGSSSTLRADRDFMRRVFGGVKYDVNSAVRLNYLTDVSDWIVKNQIVRVELKLAKKAKLYLGYQKAPFVHEDTTSSSAVKPIERSASTRFWNEFIGLGSYHSGLYLMNDYANGVSSTIGVTHNRKSRSDWPDVFAGEASGYLRLTKKGKDAFDRAYLIGVDLAYQPNYGPGYSMGASAYADWKLQEFDMKAEFVSGRLSSSSRGESNPTSWHFQVSRMFGEHFEPVIRYSQVNTDGYGAKLSTLIRKAPSSGYLYDNADSLYIGMSYYVKGNDVKLSAGYEYGNGWDTTNSLSSVDETISGFRVRGQLNY